MTLNRKKKLSYFQSCRADFKGVKLFTWMFQIADRYGGRLNHEP